MRDAVDGRFRSLGDNYTYIILLTVMGGKDSYLEGMGAGAEDFLTKPFDEDQSAVILGHLSDGRFDVTRQAKRAWKLFVETAEPR